MMDVARITAVVIGGSAGSFSALKQLLPALPTNLLIPVLIVIHQPPDRRSVLVEIFGHYRHLRVKEAEDKEPLEGGTVYFAPPGYHFLVESDRSVALATDAPVHHSRPSIDVLFESAAGIFRSGLLGVVLSGANEDGAAGLSAVARCGGYPVVQRPDTADHPEMPAAALAAVPGATLVTLESLESLFAGLPHRSGPDAGSTSIRHV
jgi:two-component system chemotaxis response regulator CheB